jgi:hypothetical protein
VPPHSGPGRPIRIAKAKVKIVHGWRTYARCADPFHMRLDKRIERPLRGRLGNNSDLRKMKARLSRALQGKDRR